MKAFAASLPISVVFLLLAACSGPVDPTVSPTDSPPDFFVDHLGGAMITVITGATSFVMGDAEPGSPEVVQQVTRGFALSQTEVTVSQYRRFMQDGGYDNNELWTDNGIVWRDQASISQPLVWGEEDFDADNEPAVGVSWYEAVAYCNWLSVQDRRTLAYTPSGQVDFAADGYRLPTEAEWEFAAVRGGTPPGDDDRLFPFGMSFDAQAVVHCTDNTAPVGSHRLGDTPLGLCDMAGNVREWCSDSYYPVVLADTSYRFTGDNRGTHFATRGGGYLVTGWYELRAAYRGSYFPVEKQHWDTGFRLLRPVN